MGYEGYKNGFCGHQKASRKKGFDCVPQESIRNWCLTYMNTFDFNIFILICIHTYNYMFDLFHATNTWTRWFWYAIAHMSCFEELITVCPSTLFLLPIFSIAE